MPDQFYQDVYDLVKLIPKGRVCSYGVIARALGHPQWSRRVGYALNQCPPDVPAHRVLNRKGLLSGKHHFGEGIMQQLLESEGVKVVDDQAVDFEQLFWNPDIEI